MKRLISFVLAMMITGSLAIPAAAFTASEENVTMPVSEAVSGAADPEIGAPEEVSDAQLPTAEEAEDPAAMAATATVTARVSQMEILLDGEQVKPSGYIIDGYTYFKLRDVAYLMRSKDSKFSVSYDAATQMISLKRGAAYAAEGGELGSVGSGDQKATAASNPVSIDGTQTTMKAYNISGYTYYQLRDIGKNLNFDVSYKDQSRQAIMKTPGYVEPAPTPTPDPAPPVVTPTPPAESNSPVDGVLTIFIDIGHGGSDSGATGIAPIAYTNDLLGKQMAAGSKVLEKDINLAVGLKLRDMLRASGVNVIMGRESDVSQGFAERKALIEKHASKTDLLFSVHHNAANTKAKGSEILAQVQYKNGGAGKNLGAILEKHYAAAGSPRRRATVFREGTNGDYYAILRYAANANVLAVISEYVFVDNAEDVLKVLSEEGLDAEAQAIHDGILEYFSKNPY